MKVIRSTAPVLRTKSAGCWLVRGSELQIDDRYSTLARNSRESVRSVDESARVSVRNHHALWRDQWCEQHHAEAIRPSRLSCRIAAAAPGKRSHVAAARRV